MVDGNLSTGLCAWPHCRDSILKQFLAKNKLSPFATLPTATGSTATTYRQSRAPQLRPAGIRIRTMPISVLIVGAGPVGLITALRLAQADIQVICLEAEVSIVRSPRAMVYHPVVTKEFERLGILADVRERGSRSESVCWKVSKTGEIIAKLEMGADDACGRESLIIGQDNLSDILLEHLDNYENCRILYGHRVVALEQPKAENSAMCQQQPQVTTICKGSDLPRQFSTDFVVAADGGRSTIRRLLGISTLR